MAFDPKDPSQTQKFSSLFLPTINKIYLGDHFLVSFDLYDLDLAWILLGRITYFTDQRY